MGSRQEQLVGGYRSDWRKCHREKQEIKFPISPGTSWQCFPQQWQNILDEALAHAHWITYTGNRAHDALFLEFLILSSLSCIMKHCEVMVKTHRFCFRSAICCSNPQPLTGFKCYLRNPYTQLADIRHVGQLKWLKGILNCGRVFRIVSSKWTWNMTWKTRERTLCSWNAVCFWTKTRIQRHG